MKDIKGNPIQVGDTVLVRYLGYCTPSVVSLFGEVQAIMRTRALIKFKPNEWAQPVAINAEALLVWALR